MRRIVVCCLCLLLLLPGVALAQRRGLKGDGSDGPYGGVASQENLRLLARVVAAEAMYEPYIVKVAVAAVVLNRVEAPGFPSTVAGAVYQPGAFSLRPGRGVCRDCLRAARDALSGFDPTGGALYFATRQPTERTVLCRLGGYWFSR